MSDTPKRVFRCPDHQWEPAKAKAEREGTNLSHVLRGLISTYLAEDRGGARLSQGGALIDASPTRRAIGDKPTRRAIPIPKSNADVLDDWLSAVDAAAEAAEGTFIDGMSPAGDMPDTEPLGPIGPKSLATFQNPRPLPARMEQCLELQEAAVLTNLPVWMLGMWRGSDCGPPSVVVRDRILYPRVPLMRWLKEREGEAID